MNANQESKPKDNITSTTLDTSLDHQNSGAAFQFKDNRQESMQLQNLQQMANDRFQLKHRAQSAISSTNPLSNNNSVIQTKIKNPFGKAPPENDPKIINILKQVAVYNSIGGFRWTFPINERKQALTQLGIVERLIFSWFAEQESNDLNTSKVNLTMKDLMNFVLTERQELITISLNNKDKDPPVANFDALHGPIQFEIRQIWAELLANNTIKIAGPKAFQIKVLTDFTRLLETKMGRTLTGGIIQAAQGLIITPTTVKEGKFVAKPNTPELEGLEEVEAAEETFVDVDVTGLEESQRLKRLQHIRGMNPESNGMSVISEKGVVHFKFGKGTGSSLPVPIDSSDAMKHASSRMTNKRGKEIIAPTFINLGHELGHVLRSAQGISAASDGGKKLLKHGFVDPEASRSEEFFNIGGVENELRKQSGIDERHGHGNLYSHVASQGMDTTFALIDEIAKLLNEVTPKSEEELQLIALRSRLNKLIEPFQMLMNGEGEIQPLIVELSKIKTDFYFR